MNNESLEITEQKEVFDFATVGEVVNRTLKKKEYTSTPLSNVKGISSGYNKIDELTSGFQKGELTVVAVKPGMGKTAFLLSLVNNIAVKAKKSIAIFSPERPADKIVKRMIETETGMSVHKILEGNLNEGVKDHMFAIIENIANSNIFIDETPSLSVGELYEKAESLKVQKSIEIIVIDHLELMKTSILDENSREDQLKSILTSIKKLAKNLDIPIVLFSQIQRGQKADDTIMTEAVLPEYITYSNDTIMLLNRTPYNLVKTNGKRTGGNAEVIITRHPSLKERKVVGLKFIESIGKFVNKEN